MSRFVLHCEACGCSLPARCWQCPDCSARAGDGWAADVAMLVACGNLLIWLAYSAGPLRRLIQGLELTGTRFRAWVTNVMTWDIFITGHWTFGFALCLSVALGIMSWMRPAFHRALWWIATMLTLLTITYLLLAGIASALIIPNWLAMHRSAK